VEQLLSTKLYIPPSQPNLISRPRLIQQLNEGLSRTSGITLVSAPAGSGKTTLISRWLEQAHFPAAWLSLDEDDNDLVRFWTYFAATLQTIHPATATHVLDLLHSTALPKSRVFLTLLINDLAVISEKMILVLDDYHVIQTEAIDETLAFFIEHMPPSMHLVICSRADPNMPIARLRARGQLTELRGSDLAFTQAETAQFLEQVTNISFTESDVTSLYNHIEGWIAGLQMAALVLNRRETGGVAQFIEEFTGSHRYIMDYLVDEVLQQQPAEVQTFLLYTSVLDQFCAPLCVAIFQESKTLNNDRAFFPSPVLFDAHKVQEVLAHLERANLFITPLDGQHRWFRYHHLFADLLRHRLGQMYPNQHALLHMKASQWYEKAGMIGPAVRHALVAQAFGRAARLVEQIAPMMIQYSELSRMLRWLDTLPDDEVLSHPLLALYFGWSLLLSGKLKQTAVYLEEIQARLDADQSKQTPEVQGHIAAMQAYLVRETGDLTSTISLSQQALAHLPKQDTLLRAMVALNLAITYYLEGAFEPASKLLTEIIDTGGTSQLMANTLSAVYLKAQLLRAQGSLQEALQLCQESLTLVLQNSWQNIPAVGFVYVSYGELLRERNELVTAAEYLEKGIKLGQEGGHPHISIIGHIWQAWLRQTQRDSTESHTSIRVAFQLVQDHQVSLFWPLPSAACYQARLWIAQGNLSAASRWAETAGIDQADSPISFFYEVQNLAFARLLIAQGNLDPAEALLERLYQTAQSAGRTGSLIEILILQAITSSAQNRAGESLSALEQALSLAEPEGFVRIFIDEGKPLIKLLRRAVVQGIHVPYALRLLQAFGEGAIISQPLIVPLSERELEILRRIAAGYSNQEIAQDLVIAVSTVKKHVNNIYGKLGVGSRTRAVAMARELRLL
jgi:LuxR family maltose regulon positive regulatory protein